MSYRDRSLQGDRRHAAIGVFAVERRKKRPRPASLDAAADGCAGTEQRRPRANQIHARLSIRARRIQSDPSQADATLFAGIAPRRAVSGLAGPWVDVEPYARQCIILLR